MTNVRVNLGKISYINVFPVYYGLDQTRVPDWLEMVPDVPAALNLKIQKGLIDISPISAAFYAMNHRDLLLLPDLSISCHGPVLSVLLASQYPVFELDGKKVILSSESATAAALIRMICAEKDVRPNFVTRPVHSIFDVTGQADAALVIGDTALTQPWFEAFSHVIDLGSLWYELTGLPFVFAVWAVRKSFAARHPQLVDRTHRLLLESRDAGERNMESIIQKGIQTLKLDEPLVRRYFDLLHCNLDNPKIHAMDLFFKSLFQHGLLPEKVTLELFSAPL